MYALHLLLIGKPMVDFIFAIIELFSLYLTVETLYAEIIPTLSTDFRGKGASSINHCWYQKARVIAISCGIKISAVHHLVLSQYTHLTDGQIDRIMTVILCVALHAVAW